MKSLEMNKKSLINQGDALTKLFIFLMLITPDIKVK